MEKTRRQFSPDQKVAIVREHLLENAPVSDVCEKHGINPTQLYHWQRHLFKNGAAVFGRPNGAVSTRKEQGQIG